MELDHLLLSSRAWVIWGKLYNLSLPQFAHLYYEGIYRANLKDFCPDGIK